MNKLLLLGKNVPAFLITSIFRLCSQALVFANVPLIPDPLMSLLVNTFFALGSTGLLFFSALLASWTGKFPAISSMPVNHLAQAISGEIIIC